MIDNKAIQILAKLEHEELKTFKDFVTSPYFNSNQSIVALVDFCIKYEAQFEHKHFTYEKAFQFVYPNKPFKKEAVQKLFSLVSKLLEEFIRMENHQEKHFRRQVELLKFYDDRGLDKHYSKLYSQLENELADTKERSRWYYFDDYLLNRENTFFLSTRQDDAVGDTNLQNLSRSFDTFYLINKFLHCCQMLNRRKIVAYDYEFHMLETLKSYFPKSPFKDVPALQVWFLAMQMLSAVDPKPHYHALKDAVVRYQEHMDREELRMIYTYLQNTLIRNFRHDQQLFYNEIFALYEGQLKGKTILQRGQISAGDYRNIVVVAIRLKHFDWVRQFVQQYKPYIQNNFAGKEDLYNYCQALILFAEGQYSEVLDILNENSYRDRFFKLHARRLRLQTYYEMDMHGPFEDLINATRKMLSDYKDQMSDYHLQANRNFVNVLVKIAQMLPKDADRASKIEEEMATMPLHLLPDKEWLSKKLTTKAQ